MEERRDGGEGGMLGGGRCTGMGEYIKGGGGTVVGGGFGGGSSSFDLSSDRPRFIVSGSYDLLRNSIVR